MLTLEPPGLRVSGVLCDIHMLQAAKQEVEGKAAQLCAGGKGSDSGHSNE